MMKIVATNVVASRSPERRPTATPTARANKTVFKGLLTSKHHEISSSKKTSLQYNGHNPEMKRNMNTKLFMQLSLLFNMTWSFISLLLHQCIQITM